MSKLVTFIKPTTRVALQLPKQEAIVLRSIADLGEASPELIAERCLELNLETRQDPVRIVEYYISDLKKRGLIAVSGEKRGAKRVTVLLEAEQE